ncbi:efflux RND transporter periplasmic adaptor subunit [Alkalimonas delamerensis]|uniref:Efflux RND transporter periplasmic adaptor subunit n=1 Tax=Alkalimonas delamerensis TaxID=265981 RepID=A0ABT9GSF8_9GAMM|nr:efflux RND transporter periplasmic adaptor subunit [Alkalimonas delamerensis]MDP4529908.1 efflux RND transporter periplasmic adaptor subunit [Alkalimonas delamerensis]
MRYWIGAVVAVAVIAFLWWPSSSSERVLYQTQSLSRGAIESVVNTAGTTRAVVTVEVGSEVSGLITAIYADFNADVEQGQLIARLDDRTFQARVRQAEADIQMSEANVIQQEANLVKAQAELLRLERAYQRQLQLMQQNLTNQTEVDNALANYEVAKAQILVSQAQLQSAKAQLTQRQAQLEQHQLDLDRTQIRSPVNGTVIDRQVDVGQTVAASLSAPTLFTIAQDLSQMQIEADVDEADIGKIEAGQQVRFQVDAHPDRQFQGVVSQVRKAATNVANVVTYKVIIDAPNRQQLLLPGMTANLNFIIGQQQDVLRIPNAALRFRPAGAQQSGQQPADRTAELLRQLDLPADKERQVRRMLQEFNQNLQQLRSQQNNNPMSNPRQAFQQARQALTNELRLVLSEEEFSRYQSLMAEQRQQTQGRGEQGRMAEVWVLNARQEPELRRVRVGLANDEFTELLSGELGEEEQIIVRAVRADR